MTTRCNIFSEKAKIRISSRSYLSEWDSFFDSAGHPTEIFCRSVHLTLVDKVIPTQGGKRGVKGMFIFYSLLLLLLHHGCYGNVSGHRGGHVSEMQAHPCCEPIDVPPILLFSIYMGKIKYNYFSLTIESMRLNPRVTFVIINIVEPHKDQTSNTENILAEIGAPNVILKVLSIDEWRVRVYDRLGIDIPFTSAWYYKLCDFKPTLGVLFSELLDSLPPSSLKLHDHQPQQQQKITTFSPYRYWGYADLDLVWGSFQRFAHLFQGDYDVVTPHHRDVVGMAAFFYLDEKRSSLTLFQSQLPSHSHTSGMIDKKGEFSSSSVSYVSLLANKTYHNLDETGAYTPPNQVQYKEFSMNFIVHHMLRNSYKQRGGGRGQGYIKQIRGEQVSDEGRQQQYRMNKGIHSNDNIHVEMKVIYHNQNIPLVSWVHGHLRIIHKRLGFPAGRDILFSHRMLNIPFPQLPHNKRKQMLQDMLMYGYLLPTWIPLLTRHMCRTPYYRDSDVSRGGSGGDAHHTQHQLYEYFPYNISCFGL